jgi:hypothetical protein
MNSISSAVAPFRGWDGLRQAIRTIGPERLLRALVRKAGSEAKESAAGFTGDALHNYLSHHIVAHILLRMLLDGEAEPMSLDAEFTSTESETIANILGQVNFLAAERIGPPNQRPAHTKRHLFQRIVRGLWVNHLEVGSRLSSPKFEIARSWLMLRQFWPARVAQISSEVPLHLRGPLVSAFQALEYIFLLHIAVHTRGPVIDNPTVALRMAEGAIDRVLDLYIPDAADVVGSWDLIENEAIGTLLNPFIENPIIRLPSGTILAPDPGVLIQGISDRLLNRAVDYYADEYKSELAVAASRLLGKVFEDYACYLLTTIGAQLGNVEVKGPFNYGQPEHESPDVLWFEDQGKYLAIFECKSARLKPHSAAALELDSMYAWFARLSGANDERGPYEQLLRFVDDWQKGDAECVRQLGRADEERSGVYLLVSLAQPPPFANWPSFRKLLFRPMLTSAQCRADQRSLYVGIGDLELYALLVNSGRCKLKLSALLSEWNAQLSTQPDFRKPNPNVHRGTVPTVPVPETVDTKGGLSDFLRQRFQVENLTAPAAIDAAVAGCFAEIESLIRGHNPAGSSL